MTITDIQSTILRILKETGGIIPENLCERLQLKPSDLKREIASSAYGKNESVNERRKEGDLPLIPVPPFFTHAASVNNVNATTVIVFHKYSV